MKKLIALTLALMMTLSLAACGGNSNHESTTPTTQNETPSEPAPPPTTDMPSDNANANTPNEDETQQANSEKVEVDFHKGDITDEKLAEMVKSGEIPANVTNLNLSGNQISDITPLSSLTELIRLNLNGNQISNVTPLSNLTNLVGLHLNGSPIIDITPLNNLINLKNLGLQGVSLTKQEADNLQAMLPNCDIAFDENMIADSDTSTYTITLHWNDENFDDESKGVETFTIKHGEPLPLFVAYQKSEGGAYGRIYTSGGWFLDAELTEPFNGFNEPATGDLTLYLEWFEGE